MASNCTTTHAGFSHNCAALATMYVTFNPTEFWITIGFTGFFAVVTAVFAAVLAGMPNAGLPTLPQLPHQRALCSCPAFWGWRLMAFCHGRRRNEHGPDPARNGIMTSTPACPCLPSCRPQPFPDVGTLRLPAGH